MNLFHTIFDKLYPVIRWNHEKRWGNAWYTEIRPKLWLGGAPTYQRDYDFLFANGIDAVLDIRAERRDNEELYRKKGVRYMHMSVLDLFVPSSEQIEQAVNWTDEQLKDGRTVLIHCAKGRGRSATLFAAYLTRHNEMTYDEAHAFMLERRPLVKLKARHKVAVENWIDETI